MFVIKQGRLNVILKPAARRRNWSVVKYKTLSLSNQQNSLSVVTGGKEDYEMIGCWIAHVA